jgi:hypothetical protein
MSFVGKFVLQCTEKEFNFGEIIDQPSPDIVLIAFDCPNCKEPHDGIGAMAFPVSDFLKVDTDGIHVWSFFKTREEMGKYVDSLLGDIEEDEQASKTQHVH